MKREPHFADYRSATGVPGMAAFDILAPNMFVLERQGTAAPVYHLAGSAIRHFIGANPQGKEFYRYWDADARETLAWYFDLSAENGTAFRLVSTRAGIGGPECKTILMPVGDADAGTLRFLGISVTRDATSKLKAPLPQHIQHVAFLDRAPAEKEVRLHRAPLARTRAMR